MSSIPSKTVNAAHVELDVVLKGAPRRFSYALIKLITAAGLDLDRKTSVLLTRPRAQRVLTMNVSTVGDLLRKWSNEKPEGGGK